MAVVFRLETPNLKDVSEIFAWLWRRIERKSPNYTFRVVARVHEIWKDLRGRHGGAVVSVVASQCHGHRAAFVWFLTGCQTSRGWGWGGRQRYKKEWDRNARKLVFETVMVMITLIPDGFGLNSVLKRRRPEQTGVYPPFPPVWAGIGTFQPCTYGWITFPQRTAKIQDHVDWTQIVLAYERTPTCGTPTALLSSTAGLQLSCHSFLFVSWVLTSLSLSCRVTGCSVLQTGSLTELRTDAAADEHTDGRLNRIPNIHS